jgi:cysteinyl-tRNA synthetase
MNITDVGHMTDDAEGGESGEDRMAVAGRRLAEAKKAGKLPAGSSLDPTDPYAIAGFYGARFVEDAKTLGLKLAIEAEEDPTLMPRATASVPGMIAVIRRLIERGCAYVAGPAGARAVYFRVRSFARYGELSGNTLDRLREGEGGRVSAVNQASKEHPADFLLWKEDPRHIMKWESPWGAGYPGWHIECTVMSARRLAKWPKGQRAKGPNEEGDWGALVVPGGEALIDLHSGGEDNIFPHHESEIAQSCCAFCEDPSRGAFARHWFHPRHLFIEGQKMSKSKGNFYTARDLFAKGVEPAALRLELIKTHYRSNANFTMQGLEDSRRMVERWRRVGVTDWKVSPDHPLLRDFGAAMNDDLNVAGALGVLNGWLGSVSSPTEADRAALGVVDRVLGVLERGKPAEHTTDIGVFVGGASPDPAVEAKLRERREARAAKDFKRSDAIRDELAAMGYAIKDAPGGRVEVSRKG